MCPVAINGVDEQSVAVNGVQVLKTLSAGSETVNKGVYAATTLSGVDADLATGNIKSGITAFGFAGSADVRDISDADLVVAEAPTGKTFYAVSGGRKTGTGTKTLNPANETVAAGYYAATTLSVVDAQLAAANIKSGVVIFGFTGAATVQDIADADAVLSDVKSGKFFYSVTGGRKTGNLATVALSAAANSYPAGYHAGAASLTAVDADLATGNIKSGITIFGVAGDNDVRDISDADLVVGEAPTGKTFYAVSGGRKTGTGTKTLDAANETVNAGYYAATTLSAVDADLAVGNIKDGVTIFGFLGTYSPTLVEDVLGNAVEATVLPATGTYSFQWKPITTGAEWTLATVTPTFAAGSLAVGAAFLHGRADTTNAFKLQCILGGVQVAESAYMVGTDTLTMVAVGTRALSGATACVARVHNYNAGTKNLWWNGYSTAGIAGGAITVGSVKI